jgi:hypothetical protein
VTPNPTVLVGTELRACGDLDSDVRILLPTDRVTFIAIQREGGLTHNIAIQNTKTGIKIIATDRNNEYINSMKLLDRDLLPL